MKKRVTSLLILCLAVSVGVLAFLWITEKSSRDDMKELAQAEAFHSYMEFAEYQASGDISRYWAGVASFRTFQQAYRSAYQGTNRSANYLICDAVYGYLLAEPEKSQTHMAEIVRMMEFLSKDIDDLNGHAQMLELRNALSEADGTTAG